MVIEVAALEKITEKAVSSICNHIYFEIHGVTTYTRKNHVYNMLSNILCDIINQSRELIDTFFNELLALFMGMQMSKEG